MVKKYPSTSYKVQGLIMRRFTFKQLSKISDDNYGVLNSCIDMTSFNENDMFVLIPVIIYNRAYGEPVDPHYRAYVLIANENRLLAFQDLTFEQWKLGQQILKRSA